MRRIGITFFLIFSLLAPTTALEAATIKSGSKCSKAGISQIQKGIRFTCVKRNKLLVWNNGVRVTTASPKPSPAATPIPTPSPSPTAPLTPTPTPTTSPSPSATPTPTSTPTTSPSASASPTTTPTPAQSPSSNPTTTSTSNNSSANSIKLTPELKFRSFDLKRCEVEITNYDSSFEWVVTSIIGEVKLVGKLITVENQNEFSGTTINVIARKPNVADGEASINCY